MHIYILIEKWLVDLLRPLKLIYFSNLSTIFTVQIIMIYRADSSLYSSRILYYLITKLFLITLKVSYICNKLSIFFK